MFGWIVDFYERKICKLEKREVWYNCAKTVSTVSPTLKWLMYVAVLPSDNASWLIERNAERPPQLTSPHSTRSVRPFIPLQPATLTHSLYCYSIFLRPKIEGIHYYLQARPNPYSFALEVRCANGYKSTWTR